MHKLYKTKCFIQNMSTKLDSYSLGPINNDTNADWLFKCDFNIASSLKECGFIDMCGVQKKRLKPGYIIS